MNNWHQRHPGVPFNTPDKFKPRRDISVDSRTVVCPFCKAEVGDDCMTRRRRRDTHPARRRMAVRLLNNSKETT